MVELRSLNGPSDMIGIPRTAYVTAKTPPVNLTEIPESVVWPESYSAFIEKVGSLMASASAAWQLARILSFQQPAYRLAQLITEKGVMPRDDFYIENYAYDSRVTPEDELIAEILVPVS